MKLFIFSSLFMFMSALYGDNSSSHYSNGYSSSSDESQQPAAPLPPPTVPAYYYPNYAPPDADINPGDTQENDIYKANQHR